MQAQNVKPSRLQIPKQDQDDAYQHLATQREFAPEHSHQHPRATHNQPPEDLYSPTLQPSPEAAHPHQNPNDQDSKGAQGRYPPQQDTQLEMSFMGYLPAGQQQAAVDTAWQADQACVKEGSQISQAVDQDHDKHKHQGTPGVAPALNAAGEDSKMGRSRPLQGVEFLWGIVQVEQAGSLSPPPGLPPPESLFTDLFPNGLSSSLSSPEEQQQPSQLSAAQPNSTMPPPSQPAQPESRAAKQGRPERGALHARGNQPLPIQSLAAGVDHNQRALQHGRPGPAAAAPAATQPPGQPSSWLQGILQSLSAAPPQAPAMHQPAASLMPTRSQHPMQPSNVYPAYTQRAAPAYPGLALHHAAPHPGGYQSMQMAGHYPAAQPPAPTLPVFPMAQHSQHPAYHPAQQQAYAAHQYVQKHPYMGQQQSHMPYAGIQRSSVISDPQHMHAAWQGQPYGGAPQSAGTSMAPNYTQTPTLPSHLPVQPGAAPGHQAIPGHSHAEIAPVQHSLLPVQAYAPYQQ